MWSDNLLITAVKNLIRKRNDNMELNRIAEELHPRSMAARDWVFQVIRTAMNTRHREGTAISGL